MLVAIFSSQTSIDHFALPSLNAWRVTGFGHSSCRSGTGSGSGQALTVYGRVGSQTTPSPGAYSDSVVVTVTY
jgi:spore coat protein U-like protein